jgi:predicted nucleotidyltransferase
MTKKLYQKEIQRITQEIVKKYKPEKIILFGSFATGKRKENSDVDLVVIKKTKKKFGARLFEVCQYIHSWLGTDILVYTPKEWEKGLKKNYYFFKEIDQKGKLIYEKSKT